MRGRRFSAVWVAAALVFVLLVPQRGEAADTLCDPAFQNCRTRLIELIRAERVGIDVAFWFMEDARYTYELVKRWQAGVPVRVLIDTRAIENNAYRAARIADLQNAGIPIRRRTASGILHWKMMLFAGQGVVQFSAANYSSDAFVYVTPYQNYVDEAIYYTDQDSVVNSFMTKYDDLWTNTTSFTNYANISTALTREYPIFTKDPELNFSPSENFRTRAVRRYDAESDGIDVVMYRITDRAHPDALIRARQRGVPVRLLTEPHQYRDPIRLWHSWNVDRLYMAGVQIRHRAHAGLLHQKSVLLRGQRMTIWGSSNWSSPSADSQEEHNYFTTKVGFYEWFSDQFDRKWYNTAGYTESTAFRPLPPDKPAVVSPADLAVGLGTSSVTLTWHAGYWAHLYDIYFGVTPEPPLFAANKALGPSQHASDYKRFTISNLQPGTTYYWRIVSKTAANVPAQSSVRSFTTAGTAAAPSPALLGVGDIVLYASRAARSGRWSVVSDGRAAGGSRLTNPNAGAAKLDVALASPSDYFELTFRAVAGQPYRLWIRGMAESNSYLNDSVHVQFSGSVNGSGTALWRIGTTSSTPVSIEAGGGAGLSGWGWADNGYGGLGPLIYFTTTGTHTIRIQRREDGVSIDQIVLSPQKFLTTAPGATKNDATILPLSTGL